jgi:hypothetical protein
VELGIVGVSTDIDSLWWTARWKASLVEGEVKEDVLAFKRTMRR